MEKRSGRIFIIIGSLILLIFLIIPPVSAEVIPGLERADLYKPCLSIWLLTGLVFMIWVYGDAVSRNKNGFVWALTALILNALGFLLWLYLRPPSQPPPPPD